MTYRIRNIVIAVGLALVAALLTTFYVANYKRHVRQTESTVKVLVAKRDIPQGTTGTELIKRGSIGTADVVQRSVVPGAISSLDQVQTHLTTQPIYAGEQVTLRRFASHQQQGIRSQLHGPLRAISLPGTGDQLLAGTLKDGDHVDIVGYWEFPEGKNHISRQLLRNVLVLQAPETSAVESHLSSNPDEGFNVMLALTDSQATRFWWLVNNGEWSLQLRPVTDPSDSPEELNNAKTNALDGLNVRQRARARSGQ